MAGILFFDIRNFSSHRQFLADHAKAGLLTKLIQSLLNKASELSGICNRICKLKKKPWMNHTGDGFILIFETDRGSLAALRFASVFRQFIKPLLDEYTSKLEQLFPTHPLQDIDWGMGLHDGGAISFTYKDVDESEKVGYIGSALNWASRVEAATKDHTFHIICTEKVRVLFLRALGSVQSNSVSKYFSALGRHRLRGLSTPIELYGCKPGIHLFIDKFIADSK
ncbi:class 3 adenylate cyclase [Roseimicrobium gellanilyticum]|uniref:Class 3 adenylate cyclase n=1 Tax=Roseimicrobium gellanilyticum TaxID=748857 RepID=A0A366HSI1_9BACT|nr:hypothetical protein [Roseimicrobium gellanilyticum]RBP45863.1 class 3 adenylate cyclase [Roseimicrobium gellanilyticum]